MKKTIALLIAIVPMIVFAQLRVDSLGYVKIINTTTPGAFNLPVNLGNLAGNSLLPIALQVNADSYNNTSQHYCFGVVSNVKNYNGFSDVRTQAVTGTAITSNTSGYTFGVVGCYDGYNGAGVYGSSSSTTLPVSDGRYAGYFDGNVKVTGTVNGTYISSSDLRLKQEVKEIGEADDVLGKLELLSPISYKYNPKLLYPDYDEKEAGRQDVKNSVIEKTHFGLVAQELQQVYPNLVYENDNGYLSINYIELIPIMLQSIKELNAKVEQLSGGSARKEKGIGNDETTGVESALSKELAAMDQNVPNPFSGKTDIAVYLPENTQTAILYIYDLSGKQVEQHDIQGRGNTVMTIHADKMDAGMYIYSLIADGKVVATKRMIVVK